MNRRRNHRPITCRTSLDIYEDRLCVESLMRVLIGGLKEGSVYGRKQVPLNMVITNRPRASYNADDCQPWCFGDRLIDIANPDSLAESILSSEIQPRHFIVASRSPAVLTLFLGKWIAEGPLGSEAPRKARFPARRANVASASGPATLLVADSLIAEYRARVPLPHAMQARIRTSVQSGTQLRRLP